LTEPVAEMSDLSPETLVHLLRKERDDLAEELAFYVQQALTHGSNYDGQIKQVETWKLVEKAYKTRERMRSIVPAVCEKLEGM
jgi:hypothetical protein